MMAAIDTRVPATLGELLEGIAEVHGQAALAVTGIASDSRRVSPGDLFLAVGGGSTHGMQYAEEAAARGAAAILADREVGAAAVTVPVVIVPGLAARVGVIAARFFGEPARAMHLIGVTGTNGKTSVTHFLAQALSSPGAPCGLVGTLGAGPFGALEPTGHTTPDPVSLQRLLDRLRSAGARFTAMEVSSHALVQERVAGVVFHTAVFTNLTHEHLDYHGDMVGYAAAKRRLFQRGELRCAVLNADDPVGSDWLASMPEGFAIDYGLEERHGRPPRLLGRDLVLDRGGLAMTVSSPWGKGRLESGLIGRFNAYNLLAALGALVAAGVPFAEALARLSRVTTVPGRVERFGGAPGQPLVVVDYAHTPDALDHVLQAVAEHCTGRLWCVFGCGGDRDRAKRPLMGRIAERHADSIVITDDNPRNEDPYAIIEAIQRGMADADAAYVIRDRGEAIAHALHTAGPFDVVLVAGKGHETEQQVGDLRLPFSDREVVARLLGEEVRRG